MALQLSTAALRTIKQVILKEKVTNQKQFIRLKYKGVFIEKEGVFQVNPPMYNELYMLVQNNMSLLG